MLRETVRVALVGDTHLTQEDFWPGPARDVGIAHDRGKYLANVAETVDPMLAEIAAAGPDLVLHSGDLAEGAPGQEVGQELRWALDHVKTILEDVPVLVIRGNHDPQVAYDQEIRPANAALVPAAAEGDVFGFDLGPLRIVGVDSQNFRADDRPALAAALDSEAPWRLVCAHSPAFNVARPFFRDPAFAGALLSLAAEQRVDVLACGHTHNSSVVSYDTGGHPLLQVMLSSVAWLDHAVPLAAVKADLVPPARRRYAWRGRLENSRPVVWALLNFTRDHLDLELRRVGGGSELALRVDRHGAVAERLSPAPLPAGPLAGRIARAWLCCSVLPGTGGRHRVRLGEAVLGEFPSTVPWYHHRTPVPDELLERLGEVNEVRLESAEDGPLAVSSLCLEVELADGTRRYSRPAPGIYLTTDRYDRWPEPDVVRAATAAELPAVRLSFD